jgi:AraC family ethanolamine operon transcriptional activator
MTEQRPLFPTGRVIDRELTDFDQLREHALGWDLTLVQRGPGPMRCRIRVFHTAFVQFGQLELSVAYTASGLVPKGAWTAGVIDVAGTAGVRSRGVELGPLEFCIATDRRELEIAFGGPSRQLVLSAQEAIVESFALPLRREPLPSGDRMRFASQSRRSAFEREALSWLNLAHDKPELLSDRRFTTTLEYRFLESLLCGCVTSAPIAAKPFRHAVARKARGYILERLSQPLSVAEMCRHFEVSERTLLQGFVEIYGTGPIAYAKQCRLDAAHRALRACEGSVSDVAMQWGFFHLGRFSKHYRDAFGYPPSRTPRVS